MRILITGSEGFIGQALEAELEEHGHKVTPYDIKFGLDVRRRSLMTSCIRGQDLVVHLAAEVGKLNCESNPRVAIDVNVSGTLIAAQECARQRVPLVFCSSSEVYGDFGEDEVEERGAMYDYFENPAFSGTPSGIYALSKRWGEEACETYAPEGLKIIRPTMPYGPGVPPGPGRRALDNLIHQALTGKPMVVHRGAARSWCWISDLARGMRYVIERGDPGVYNVGRDDDEISMEHLAIWIWEGVHGNWRRPSRDEMTIDPKIKIIDTPERQTAVKRISCAKLRALGWEPEVSLDEGLPRMVEWVKEYVAREGQGAQIPG